MTMRALGTCRNQDCGQTDLLWADGFCSDDCREEATGCPVPLCGCGGACGCGCALGTSAQQPDRKGGP